MLKLSRQWKEDTEEAMEEARKHSSFYRLMTLRECECDEEPAPTPSREVTAPQPNSNPGVEETESEFRYRVKDPQEFERFRRGSDVLGKDADVIFGFKDDAGSEIQAIRFTKPKFKTKDDVEAWLKAHKETVEEIKKQ